jgi:deferrochelatase/peroxidase EfeB
MSGVGNINITAGANSTNNFIFNHTAPINLNFYKDGQSNPAVTSPVGQDAELSDPPRNL